MAGTRAAVGAVRLDIRPGLGDLLELADAIRVLAENSLAGKLAMSDAEGACFTISNLGQLGGTGFTPNTSAPEIAILGMGHASPKAVKVDGAFATRLMLPLTLVYDHRVIDGAIAGRFLSYVTEQLRDPKQMLVSGPV